MIIYQKFRDVEGLERGVIQVVSSDFGALRLLSLLSGITADRELVVNKIILIKETSSTSSTSSMDYMDYKQSGNIWNEFIISDDFFTKLSLLPWFHSAQNGLSYCSTGIRWKISNAENDLQYRIRPMTFKFSLFLLPVSWAGHSHWGRQYIYI